jgi:hypothetical protein
MVSQEKGECNTNSLKCGSKTCGSSVHPSSFALTSTLSTVVSVTTTASACCKAEKGSNKMF